MKVRIAGQDTKFTPGVLERHMDKQEPDQTERFHRLLLGKPVTPPKPDPHGERFFRLLLNNMPEDVWPEVINAFRLAQEQLNSLNRRDQFIAIVREFCSTWGPRK